jgi:hypothetical protein
MKKNIVMLSMVSLLLLSSCGAQKFYIGDTSGQTISKDKRKMVHLFWILPIGKKQSFPAVADAKGYVIITRHTLFDYLITGITGSIVDMKTVKFEAVK